jgi:hypothetical protein
MWDISYFVQTDKLGTKTAQLLGRAIVITGYEDYIRTDNGLKSYE